MSDGICTDECADRRGDEVDVRRWDDGAVAVVVVMSVRGGDVDRVRCGGGGAVVIGVGVCVGVGVATTVAVGIDAGPLVDGGTFDVAGGRDEATLPDWEEEVGGG